MTLEESAYKKAKDGLQPLQEISSTTPAYTQDDIIALIKAEVAKVAPVTHADPTQSVVTQSPDVAVSTEPKPITEVIQQTIDQVGEQA